jgi:hypothetical protein
MPGSTFSLLGFALAGLGILGRKLSNFRLTRAFLNKFKSHFGRSFREQIAAPHDWNPAWYNVGPNL